MIQLLQIDILKHTSILNNVGDIVLCIRDWTTEPEVHLFYIVLYLLCHLTFNRHAKLQYCVQLSCSTFSTTCIYLRSKDDNRYVRTNSFLTKINANWWQLNHIWRCPDNINAVKCTEKQSFSKPIIRNDSRTFYWSKPEKDLWCLALTLGPSQVLS